MTDLQKFEKAKPRGRIDVAVFRMGDAIGRKKLPNVWPEIREYWAVLVTALFPPHNRRRRRAG